MGSRALPPRLGPLRCRPPLGPGPGPGRAAAPRPYLGIAAPAPQPLSAFFAPKPAPAGSAELAPGRTGGAELRGAGCCPPQSPPVPVQLSGSWGAAERVVGFLVAGCVPRLVFPLKLRFGECSPTHSTAGLLSPKAGAAAALCKGRQIRLIQLGPSDSCRVPEHRACART